MNKEQQQIIDEVYDIYFDTIRDDSVDWLDEKQFIDKVKTDEFTSVLWGLKIEERELSFEEKYDWIEDNTESYMKANSLDYDLLTGNISLDHIKFSLSKEAPTKLITITYNDKTIESYDY